MNPAPPVMRIDVGKEVNLRIVGGGAVDQRGPQARRTCATPTIVTEAGGRGPRTRRRGRQTGALSGGSGTHLSAHRISQSLEVCPRDCRSSRAQGSPCVESRVYREEPDNT